MREKFRGSCGGIGETRSANLVGVEDRTDGIVVKRRAEISVAHGLERQALPPVQERSERGAEGDAIVGSGRLHKNILHDTRRSDFTVGLRIERHAARETEILAAGFLQGQSHHVQHRGFAQVLHCVSDVLMKIVDLTFRFTRRAKRRGPAGIWVTAGAMEQIGMRFVGSSANIQEHA